MRRATEGHIPGEPRYLLKRLAQHDGSEDRALCEAVSRLYREVTGECPADALCGAYLSIPVGEHLFALVDVQDYDRLTAQTSWHPQPSD